MTRHTPTKIALIGGTGAIGEALALRFGRDTDSALTIGSWDERKALEMFPFDSTEERRAAGLVLETVTDMSPKEGLRPYYHSVPRDNS